MGNQTDYEKALKEAWERVYQDNGGLTKWDNSAIFDSGFLEGYRYGFGIGVVTAKAQDDNVFGHIAEATEKAGKEVNFPTRAQIATMAMQGLLHDSPVEEFSLRIKPPFIAKAAVEYADALLAELAKGGKE